MPTINNNRALNATSVEILNAIRNSATANYQNYVPAAGSNLDSIRDIGAVLMTYPALQNEFLSALVNRIALVLVTSKSYDNPWSMFKRGMLEFGETIEDIFVNIAQVNNYDPDKAASEVYKREIPDVRAAFHIMNYQKFYKNTISQDQLRQAFLTWDGITNLIAKIVDAMYTSMNYDEFTVMKYMIARHLINGEFYPVQISIPNPVTEAGIRRIAAKIKGISNDLEFMSSKYNRAKVFTHTNKEDQYLILNAAFDADMDVEVLAAAFHMDKAEFMGHRITVDSFGELDTDRLDALFEGADWYTRPTTEELAALDAIPGILVDKDWFMIFDNLINFTENYNGQGLYWNYFLHTWKTFSSSPFANAVVFVPGAPAVSAVTVTPESATVYPGQGVQLTAEVTTANFASKVVTWSTSDKDVAVVDIYGNVTVPADATGGDTATITATSVVNTSVTDTCTITVGGEAGGTTGETTGEGG